MKLTFVGSGDAFGSGGRFNTCFHVASAAKTFLIDCGATSLVALKRLDIDLAQIRTIFISHLHGDHFGGLPFFLLDAQFVHRRELPLTIAGPVGMQERLVQVQEVLFAGSSKNKWNFELDIVEMRTGVESSVHGANVTPFEVEHFSGAPSHALRIECDGRIVTYSGDTEWVDALVPAAEGADLFICECFGYRGTAPYHLDHDTLAAKRHLFTARRMIITHMGPDMLANLSDTGFEAASDGMVIDV
jgi:ribonuclease BN (tRNA processing enzyme)